MSGTSVASNGCTLSSRDLPVAASATYTRDASSKFAMYATRLPSGDHFGLDTLAPFGVSMARRVPVAASMSASPDAPRVVSARARFALKSTWSPPK